MGSMATRRSSGRTNARLPYEVGYPAAGWLAKAGVRPASLATQLLPWSVTVVPAGPDIRGLVLRERGSTLNPISRTAGDSAVSSDP